MAKQPDGRSSIDRANKAKWGPSHWPSVRAGALAIIILLTLISVRLLGDQLYNFPTNPEKSAVPADAAIVCLAGGKFRVEAAFSLFAEGVGKKLVIIGAGKKSTAAGLARAHAEEVATKIPEDRFQNILVETDSENTLENAFAVNRFLIHNPEIKTIVLVTSGYHMRRSQVLINLQVHRKVNIIPFTPPTEAIDRNNWWHSWIGMQVTTEEYFKYLLSSWIFPRLSDY